MYLYDYIIHYAHQIVSTNQLKIIMYNTLNYIILISILFIIQSTIIFAVQNTDTKIDSPTNSYASIIVEYNKYNKDYIPYLPSAKWIWSDDGNKRQCAMNISISHEFRLNCSTQTLYIYIGCSNYCEAYLNDIKLEIEGNIPSKIYTSSHKCGDKLTLVIFAKNDPQRFCDISPANLIYDFGNDKLKNLQRSLDQQHKINQQNGSSSIIAVISISISMLASICIFCIYLICRKKTQTKIKQFKPPQSMSELKYNTCIVCQHDNGDLDLITPCDHQFHFKCFKQWVDRNAKCPNCYNIKIEIVKVKLCFGCNIFQFFDPFSTTFIERVKRSKQKLEGHLCDNHDNYDDRDSN